MTLAATFLGGAKNRLLPASIPFRFFAAAAGFHVLAWLVLLFGAGELARFIGGPGLLLVSLHLLTLGVLVMTAMGASFQLLPVATRQPLLRKWPAKLCFWLFMPGTLLLAWGMVEASATPLYLGGTGVGGGLLVFALLMADNLRRARSAMPIVTAHGWGALAALLGFSVLGLSLILDFDKGFLVDRQSIATAHMVLAAVGFMGLLVFGFSQVLIPMFVLSRTLPVRLGWFELILALVAVVLAGIGAMIQNDAVTIAAILVGLAASSAYLWLMRSAFQTSMRKRLGLSFVVIRASWGLLILALLTVLGVMLGVPVPNGMTLFVFLLLVGWLLTFLTGILQRIMPFLASMHVVGKGGRPPLLSELTAERPLMVHAVFHFSAIAVISAGIVLEAPMIIKLGATLGFVGAVAFAVFVGFVVVRLKET
ncbi:hypothetical protein MNBD_ALPHA08-1693 [hydrothermal vent metagenome]|uniref:NnrS protein involved in response to NO n=1 Tax=hydrothermal vent metagenome TaxID=652676 RepID=A0A3B0RD49_9ZZZZ